MTKLLVFSSHSIIYVVLILAVFFSCTVDANPYQNKFYQINTNYELLPAGKYSPQQASRIFENSIRDLRVALYQYLDGQASVYPVREYNVTHRALKGSWSSGFYIPLSASGTAYQINVSLDQYLEQMRQQFYSEIQNYYTSIGKPITIQLKTDGVQHTLDRDYWIQISGNLTADQVAKSFIVQSNRLTMQFDKYFGIQQGNIIFKNEFFNNALLYQYRYNYKIPLAGQTGTIEELREYVQYYVSLIKNELFVNQLGSQRLNTNPLAPFNSGIQPENQPFAFNFGGNNNAGNAVDGSDKPLAIVERNKSQIETALNVINNNNGNYIPPSTTFDGFTTNARDCAKKNNALASGSSEANVFKTLDCLLSDGDLDYSSILREICNRVDEAFQGACLTLKKEQFKSFNLTDFDPANIPSLRYEEVANSVEKYFTEGIQGTLIAKQYHEAKTSYNCITSIKTAKNLFDCVDINQSSVNEKNLVIFSSCYLEGSTNKGECVAALSLGAREKDVVSYVNCVYKNSPTSCTTPNFIDKKTKDAIAFSYCMQSSITAKKQLKCFPLNRLGRTEKTYYEAASCYMDNNSLNSKVKCLAKNNFGKKEKKALELANCMTDESTSSGKFACIAASNMGDKEAQFINTYNCMVKGASSKDKLSCLASSELGDNEADALKKSQCLLDAEDWLDRTDCFSEGNLGAREKDAIKKLQCAKNSTSYIGAAACISGADLTKEQQVYVDCIGSASGGPYTYAACVGGGLAKNEMEACLNGGFGGEKGCFGKNNFFRLAAEDVRRGLCSAVGKKSDMCKLVTFTIDNAIMPGKNHEIAKYFNGAINDLTNGPGPNNEFRKATEAAEKFLNDAGNEAAKVLENPGKAAEDIIKNGTKVVNDIAKVITNAAPKITIKPIKIAPIKIKIEPIKIKLW